MVAAAAAAFTVLELSCRQKTSGIYPCFDMHTGERRPCRSSGLDDICPGCQNFVLAAAEV